MESGVEEVMEWCGIVLRIVCGIVLRIVCKAEFKTMNEWINEWINYQGRHRAARAAKKPWNSEFEQQDIQALANANNRKRN